MIQSPVCASYGKDNELLPSTRGIRNDAENVAIYRARRLSGQEFAAATVPLIEIRGTNQPNPNEPKGTA